MKNIKEVVIDDQVVYLKKGMFGMQVIHPIKTDGKINWKNLIAGGSWLKLGLIALFVLLALGLINEYVTNMQICNACLQSQKMLVGLGL